MQAAMNYIRRSVRDAGKRSWASARKWSGRPGYLGFALLGLGTFASGVRHDTGMGLLLITIIIAFVGEQIRMWKMIGKGGAQ